MDILRKRHAMHHRARQIEGGEDGGEDAPRPSTLGILLRPIVSLRPIVAILLLVAVAVGDRATCFAQDAAPKGGAQVAEPPAAEPPAAEPPAAEQPPAEPPPGDAEAAAAKQYAHAVVIRFEGMIHRMLEEYLYRKLDAAAALDPKPDLIVIEIDSPGGDAEASFRIAERLRDLNWAHTVAYIPENAYSGAAVVALGCDEIVMGESGRLGDVGVIFFDEESEAMRYVPEKLLSAWVPRIRGLAEAKGRSPALAEAMMDRKKEVYAYRNTRTGEQRYMTEADAKQAGEAWKQGAFVAESATDRFLTVGGKRAMELKLADGLAESRAAVMQRYGVEEPPVVMRWTAVDTTVLILNLPIVTGLLIVIGLVALYIEFSAPGIGIGGLIAGLCFVLFFWAHFMGGTAGWLEAILFLGGIVFLGVELFVLPGFGVVGLSGLLLMLASVVLALQDFALPKTDAQMSTFTTNLLIVAGSGVTFFAAALVCSRYFGMIPVLRALRLEPPASATSPMGKTGTTADEFPPLVVGATGEAHTALRPGGKATFDGRLVDVVADATFIERGQPVEVVEIVGTRVVVREA